MKPRLIFLSYHGPEERASGIRAGKLARAASQAGYSVVLVHAGSEGKRSEWRDRVSIRTFQRFDPSLMRDKARAQLPALGDTTRHRTRRGGRIIRSLARVLLQPDEMILSLPAFTEAACEEVGVATPGAVQTILVATCPPWSTALAALSVARQTGIPLIMDLVDLWSTNPVGKWPLFGLRLARRWEAKAMKRATAFIYVNDRISQRYRETWPAAERQPSIVAPIAFEHSIPPQIAVNPNPVLKLGFFGSLYADRSLTALLEACASGGRRRAVLHWYGELLGDHPLKSHLEYHVARGALVPHALVPYAQARSEMTACDILVTIPSPSYPEELTTKLYDYIDAGRPVLGLAPDGSLMSEFIKASRIGWALPPGNVEELVALLDTCSTRGFALSPDHSYLKPHTLAAVGGSFAPFISAVAARFTHDS